MALVANIGADALFGGFAGAVTPGVEAPPAVVNVQLVPAVHIRMTRNVRGDAVTTPMHGDAEHNHSRCEQAEKTRAFGLHERPVSHSKPRVNHRKTRSSGRQTIVRLSPPSTGGPDHATLAYGSDPRST